MQKTALKRNLEAQAPKIVIKPEENLAQSTEASE